MSTLITAYDTQRLGGGMVEALVAQEIQRQNAETERRHAAELRAASEPGTMMAGAYRRYWRNETAKARRKYGHNPRHSRAARLLMGLYGLMILEITDTWRWLEAWNREGT